MLVSLAIRDLVIIEALDLEFGPGLGVLTGETGAGKSILLDALGLTLGARADTSMVRGGARKAVVAAGFEMGAAPPAVHRLLDDADIEIEPGEPLLIRRQLRADGGSRAFINDQPVAATFLRELGGHLVEIHGQHDDRGLLNPRGHRRLLEAFGRINTTPVAVAHAAWREADERLATACDALADAEADRDLLLHNLQELRAFKPVAGEEAALAAERAAMQKGEKLTGDLTEIGQPFDGSDSAIAQLRVAARRLDRIATEHPLLAEALAALDRAVIDLDEAEEKLTKAADALAFDADRLDTVETRLFELRALARKHNVEGDALPALLEKLERQWAALESGGADLASLEKARDAARAAYVEAAEALSAERRAAGERLDAAVAEELAPLKLDAARFRTGIDPLPEGQWGAEGVDRVEFLISTNPGSDFAPLTKIASGGELSRFILALKVALAERGAVPTMIFDEIDRGVGGAVASAIGERLSRLAHGGDKAGKGVAKGAGQGAQVLVVTHSPQVAAQGDTHWLITKASDGTVARTNVTPLDGEGRRQEIARMLSGAEVTDEARAQAKRLLEGV